jgi:hypothetical protein
MEMDLQFHFAQLLAKLLQANTHYLSILGHAAWTFSKDMQHGHASLHFTNIQHGPAAWTYSRDMQHVLYMLHVNMQHGEAAGCSL